MSTAEHSTLSRQRLEDGRRWGSALLKQRHALERAGIVIDHIRIHGTQVRVGHKDGRGRPLLICNGIGANLEILAPLVEAIHDRPVILFDIPGTGGSENAWMVPPWMHKYSSYARRVLHHFEVREFDLAGISWGGLLAQRVARDSGDRVKNLVLMAASSGILMVPGRVSALRLMFTPRRYLSRSFMVKHAATLYGGELLDGAHGAVEHAAMARAPSALSYVQQLAAAQYFTSLPWLWRIRCPALVMIGDDDPLMRV
ncbi:MAG TPA: alpha/beta fold hydrolase, partial [Nevskiaceae bacterium]|nr:alpha/beta fold hydrolase [Nevskiaceae bacterium]